MNKYLSRITSSARGENFNPLSFPFLAATFSYGVGFTVFAGTSGTQASSLWAAMTTIAAVTPFIWGVVCVLTILVGLSFLMFNVPPAGKISGLVGFMLWVFASFCYILTGGWLLLFSVALPNAFFWVWQYLSLSLFRREDAEDLQTMRDYDTGKYDDETQSKRAGIDKREHNRGVDRQ
jgi:hypothetical protein